MIVIHTVDDVHSADDAARVATDEHNNLVIYAGRDADQITRIFARGVWQHVEVDYAD